MRIAFFASDAIAIEAMEYLSSGECAHELVCVMSNPDRPKGRGQKLSPNDAAAWAIQRGLPLLRPEHNPAEAEIEFMRALGVDCILVMAYGHILRRNILDFPKFGCLNLHASLLPKFRGASPIESAIALGEKITGVSLMKIFPKMDTGDVCAKISVDIDERETSLTLRKKISAAAAEILKKNLDDVENVRAVFIPQDDALATYVRKLDKSDMRLDFEKPAAELDARVRAFGGGFFECGGVQIKVCEAFAEDADARNAQAGMVSIIRGDGCMRVACGRGTLRMTRLQRPCAKMANASDFLNSFEISDGDVLESGKNSPLLKNL